MPRSVNSEIVDMLREKIKSGGFDQVAFLPSERKLAEEYNVGRGIIRGALRVLCEEGVLYNIPKRGLRVKKSSAHRMKRIILRMQSQISFKAYEMTGIIGGICAGANDIFAEVVLSSPPAEFDFYELKERYNSGDIQGIIFLELFPEKLVKSLLRSGVPCVIANLEAEAALPGVRMDYRDVGRQAGQRLLRSGCSRLALYTGATENFIYREIVAGFRGAIAEENMFLDERMVVVGSSEEDAAGREKLKALLELPADERPEAIFTVRDYRAERVYKLCDELGLKIPEDIELISFDNVSWPDAEARGVSAVSENVHEIGRQAVQLLEEMYESGCRTVIRLVTPQLIERCSLREIPQEEKIIHQQVRFGQVM